MNWWTILPKWLRYIIVRLSIVGVCVWIRYLHIPFGWKLTSILTIIIVFIFYSTFRQMYPDGVRRYTPEEIAKIKELKK